MADDFKSDLEMDRAALMARDIDPDYNDEDDSLTGDDSPMLEAGKTGLKTGLAFLQLLAKKMGFEVNPTKDNKLGFNEGGLSLMEPETASFGSQMEMMFTPEIPEEKTLKKGLARRPGFRSLEEAKGQVSEEEIMAGLDNAASFIVPYYDAGVNVYNVIEEYEKPEAERDYDYINSELSKAGQSAAIETGAILAGFGVMKYGPKVLKKLKNKAKEYELDPSSVSSFGVGSIRKKAIQEGVPTVEAAGLTDKAIDAWRKANETSPEFRKSLKGRNPELQAQAKRLGIAQKFEQGVGGRVASGISNVVRDSYRKLADELRPIRKVTEVPKPATNKEIVSALNKNYRKNPVVGLNGVIPEKDIVDVRLNIPAYTDYNVWVPTIRHAGKEKYKAAVRIQNVKFIQPDSSAVRKAQGVAEGREKSPFAVMTGEYVDGTDDQIFDMAKEVFDSSEWTQVGYDPIKRGFFYDRETGEAILEATEVIQVGHLVLAKNAKKVDPKVFGFNEGGAVEDQMEMMFKSSRTDPVSGNEVPIGSMPEEVRDDIPAMLSEGEYVVPADVVRYYGVKFFEDLRTNAKMGLQDMAENGRIGGEPVDGPQDQEMSDEEFLMIVGNVMGGPQEMNEGGVVRGYNQAGMVSATQPYTPNFQQVPGFSAFAQQPLAQQYLVPGAMTAGVQPDLTPTGAAPAPATPTGAAPVATPSPSPEYCSSLGMRYDANTKTCVPMQQQSDNDGPKPPEVEPSNWYDDIDWSDSIEKVDALTGDPSLMQKGASAIAGAALGPLGAAAGPIMQVSNLADAHAMANVYEAMGDTERAEQIRGKIGARLEESKVTNMAYNAIDSVFGADGDRKTMSLLKAAGVDMSSLDGKFGKELNTAMDNLLKTMGDDDRRKVRIFTNTEKPKQAAPTPKTTTTQTRATSPRPVLRPGSGDSNNDGPIIIKSSGPSQTVGTTPSAASQPTATTGGGMTGSDTRSDDPRGEGQYGGQSTSAPISSSQAASQSYKSQEDEKTGLLNKGGLMLKKKNKKK